MVSNTPQHQPGRWEDCPHCLSKHKVNCWICKKPTGLTMADSPNNDGLYFCVECRGNTPAAQARRAAWRDDCESLRQRVMTSMADLNGGNNGR